MLWLIPVGVLAAVAIAGRKNAQIRKYEDELENALGSLDPMRVLHLADKFSGEGRFGAEQLLRTHAQNLQRQGYGQAVAGQPNVQRNPARLSPGETLQPQLDKRDHAVRGRGANLVFQTDGNLVLYGPGKQVLWATNTNRSGISRLAMQTDGNLVIYDNSGQPVWTSGTQGNPGAWLEVRSGAAAVVGRRGVLWSSPSSAAAQAPGAYGAMPRSTPAWSDRRGVPPRLRPASASTRTLGGRLGGAARGAPRARRVQRPGHDAELGPGRQRPGSNRLA